MPANTHTCKTKAAKMIGMCAMISPKASQIIMYKNSVFGPVMTTSVSFSYDCF